MPRSTPVPSYRLHKPSGQAVVTIRTAAGERRDVYLGVYNSFGSRAEYGRLVAELATAPAAAAAGGTTVPRVTVDQVVLAYLKHAAAHYRGAGGEPTGEVREIKRAVLPLHKLYGHTPAADFGPLALATVRQEMIKAGLCRKVINQRADRLKRLFKWAASQELVPAAAYQALRTLAGLQKGRTEAPESEPVTPVDPAHVAATLPFLGAHVRAMVELQLLTGMRPGEVCGLRLVDVDTAGDVWFYRPRQHKTLHRGKDRVIPIGPKARAVLAAFHDGHETKPDAPVFSPAASRAEWLRALRATRKTPIQPSQVDRKKAKPKRAPGHTYSVGAYNHAIAKAAVKAGVPHWSANQLRHTFATKVRKSHGLEAAQVALGHARADITQVYAEKNQALGAKVAAECG